MAIGHTYKYDKKADISPDAVKCFVENFKNPNRDDRLMATYAFQFLAGRKGTEESLPAVAECFVKCSDSRSNLIHVFRAYGDRSLTYLKKALAHSDEQVRIYALSTVFYLGPIGRPLLPEIEKALSDPSEDVKFHARFARDKVLQATK